MATIRAARLKDQVRELAGQVVWAIVSSGISERHVHFRRHRNLDLPAGLEHIDLTAAAAQGASPLKDWDSHGTMIAGIVAGEVLRGEGTLENGLPLPPQLGGARRKAKSSPIREPLPDLSGVAPPCRLLSVKVLGPDGQSDDATILEGLRRLQAMNDFGRVHRVHGVLFALGGEFDSSIYPCGMSPLCVEIDRMVRMGICVVVAAGNEGFIEAHGGDERPSLRLGSIDDPGNAELAITVGSTHREIPETAGVSYFSSKGPTRDGRLKPDIVAPGERIVCCCPNESAKRTAPTSGYTQSSGTSFSAAMVAGAAAALQGAFPGLIGRPLEVKRILLDSALDLKRDQNFQGRGLLNLEAAFDMARSRFGPIAAPQPQTAHRDTIAVARHAARADQGERPAKRIVVRLMCSYAHADLTLWEELQKHLAGLKRQGLLETWYDQEIDAGSEWEKAIKQRLEDSDVFIMLISSHFLASDYCWSTEMTRALERHNEDAAVVIPVIARPCDWEAAPFAKLEAVPRKGKLPVTSFDDQHEAWSEVTKKVRAVVERLVEEGR
ncbi:S8 family serine peptidase [Aquabacterium humicola]|uniref:S8 family serine peptidase n=1 Tax=Aquabacterium humicola TaxID=3237377 RepID=UPI0025439357|nr:S8 family serine peptidase [Rubrivivax pictus]